MNITTQQAIAAGIIKVPPAPARLRFESGMNKWEHDFSRHLEHLKTAGVILQWGYECIRLRIGTSSDAKGSRAPMFTPDFFAVMPDGRLRFYEVKGFFREAAKVRSGVAAGLFPHFTFIVVRLVKGKWQAVESFNTVTPNVEGRRS